MTLKVRLASVMIALLIAVTAVQFFLAQREQQDLADRLSRLSTAVNTSTRDVSLRALAIAAEGEKDSLQRFIAELEVQDSTMAPRGQASVHILRRAVPGLARSSAVSPDLPRWEAAIDSVTLPEGCRTVRRITVLPDGGRIVETEIRLESDNSVVEKDSIRIEAHTLSTPPGDVVAFHFPLPIVGRDSLFFAEIRYPSAELTSALESSRRRSMFWMTSLLGVGALGAALIAIQFTRPIRVLEESFRRVEEGDLGVSIEPRRGDEIGKLTGSFNRMVGRLRQTRELETRLAASERLASMGRLAAGVAHEVRNPLNAIQLTLQQMRDKAAPGSGTPERADFDRYLGTVSTELQRLERVVSAFLDLSRSEAVDLSPMELRDSLAASVALFRPDAESKGVTIDLDADRPIDIEADAVRLAAVWNNLLSNALAATPAGGSVRVRATSEGDVARVDVTDTGSGIEAAELPHIWDPFYTRRSDGTGLGLSIVRSVVERHGGRVEASSRPGEGTTISVWLPCRRAQT